MTHPPLPLRAHLTSDLPDGVEPIVRKCLSKDRSDRYDAMDALSSALRMAVVAGA